MLNEGKAWPHGMLQDSMCWISETFQGKAIEESTVLTEAVCRNKCRLSKRCSHFTWSQDRGWALTHLDIIFAGVSVEW